MHTALSNLLSRADVELIHEHSLRVLESVGIRVPSADALGALEAAGAKIDRSSLVARLPRSLVEQSVQRQVANNERYYGSAENAKPSEVKMWMSMGNLPQYVDLATHSRRACSLQDMVNAIVVGNSLSHVERVSCFTIPEEYADHEFVDLMRYYLLATFSDKRRFLTPVESGPNARAVVEMAKIVADGDQSWKNGDLVYFEIEPVANLEFSAEHLDVLVELCRAGVTAYTTHWGWMGYHTPPTYAALASLANANILGGMTLIGSLNPDNSHMDYLFPMHATNPDRGDWPLFGSPTQVIVSLIGKQLADFYGFAYSLSNCFFSDSVEPDLQMGFERGVTAGLSLFGGISMVGVQGIVGADEGVSLEQLILDNEMLDYLNFVLAQEIAVNDETLALDTILQVGIGRDFTGCRIDQRSGPVWQSDLFSHDRFQNHSKDQLIARTGARLKELLSRSPVRPVIDDSRRKALDEVLARSTTNGDDLERFTAAIAPYLGNGRS